MALWWGFFGTLSCFSARYFPGMDTERSKELWDRLENEPERAYRAIESYPRLPSGERPLVEAYTVHVGNPDAVKPSEAWAGCSREFAWREQEAAYDDQV